MMLQLHEEMRVMSSRWRARAWKPCSKVVVACKMARPSRKRQISWRSWRITKMTGWRAERQRKWIRTRNWSSISPKLTWVFILNSLSYVFNVYSQGDPLIRYSCVITSCDKSRRIKAGLNSVTTLIVNPSRIRWLIIVYINHVLYSKSSTHSTFIPCD